MPQIKITFSETWATSYAILAGYAARYGVSPATLARMLLIPAIKRLDAEMIARGGGQIVDGQLIETMDLFESEAQDRLNEARKADRKRDH